MLVKALYNTQNSIPEDLQRYAFEADDKGNLPLTIGKDYVVSGIRKTLGHTFFLIVSDEGETQLAPWWYPSELFEIVESTRPSDWISGGDGEDSYETFEELAKDRTEQGMFASDLEDGEQAALDILRNHYDRYRASGSR